MTITYTRNVATSRYFGCFLPLLFRWRGSIYKLVWLNLLCFLCLYYVLNLSYRYLMNPGQKAIFENVVQYCNNSSLIPLSFVLGFYVSIVMGRWWAQYLAIPWPDSIAVFVSAHIQGLDERGRLLRRTIMRYVCLCLTMVFTYVSYRVKKRFPNWDYLVEAGLLLENEKVIIKRLDTLFPNYPLHWLPIVWSASIVKRARRENRIRDDFAVKTIIDELNKFRGSAGFVLFYDFISVPLVYTQVVTLAVYSYFVFQVIGSQYLGKVDSDGYEDIVDKYFPVFATLEFFFYMGWLKVAESLINPFGDDDDDFEVNWLIDRNLLVSYLIVDEMHNDHPELVRDQYWDEVFPSQIRYSMTSKVKREEPPEPSTAKVVIAHDSNQAHSVNSLFRRFSSASVRFRSLKDLESSSSSDASRVSRQIGVVSPMNIAREVREESSPPQLRTATPDDFEVLRRSRQAERLLRQSRIINRTVLDMHSVADSTSIVQLLPKRSLVITDSEQSFVSEMLFGDPEDKEMPATTAKVAPKSPTKHKVKFPDQNKRHDKKTKSKKDSIKREIPKLALLAGKAHDDVSRASTSQDAATQGSTTRIVPASALKKSKATPTKLISDSEGSISFIDVEDDEIVKNKEKLKQDSIPTSNRNKEDSEASTFYSEASDDQNEFERPEIFIDKSPESDAETVFADTASDTVERYVADESKEQYYSPEESDKEKKKKSEKKQDNTKKKR